MRYIGPTTPEQLAESVQAWIVAYHKHGYGLLAVEHLADQRFIGFWRSAVFKTIPVDLYRYSQLG